MSATSRPSLQLLELGLDALQLGIAIVNEHGAIILWNQWMAKHSGLAKEQVISLPLIDLFPELRGSRLIHAIAEASDRGLPAVLSPALHRSPLPLFVKPEDRTSNRRLHQMIHVLPLSGDQNGNRVLIQVTDMTTTVNRENLLRQQSAELRRTNYQDALTGIANRRKFDETLTEEFRRAQRTKTPLALALIDIDHFKRYNDHYGHVQGDQCLTRVADGLQSCLKRAGDLAARYGGEEFGIVLPGMDEARASQIAEDLRQRIAALAIRHEASAVAPHVTISVGVAVLTPELGSNDFNALVSSADVALYQAKQEGRNRSILFSISDGSFHACG